MKKNILSMFIAIMMVVLSAMPVFAEETTAPKREDHKIENEIAGKITSINENYVTIEVATPNKIERPERSEKSEKPEKPEKKDNGANIFKQEEQKNIADMFTLTGEKKTINISKAKFMGEVRIMNDNNKDNVDATKENINNEKSKELAYTDFAVGDYIRIVLADDGSNVAKVVMKGGLFRNKPEGQAGNKPNKKPDNKQEN